MKHYIGKINFDCDLLLKELEQVIVEPQHGHMELDPSSIFYNDYVEQTNMLRLAGYDDNTVEYRHYQAGEHFDLKYSELFGKFVGAKPLMCWVSEIRPGKSTPWHWDINPWEEEHKQHGKLVRYFMFLSKPAPGHVFMTNDDCYYNEPQGSVYKYEDIHQWHAGSNVGIIPKFLMTFTGAE